MAPHTNPHRKPLVTKHPQPEWSHAVLGGQSPSLFGLGFSLDPPPVIPRHPRTLIAKARDTALPSGIEPTWVVMPFDILSDVLKQTFMGDENASATVCSSGRAHAMWKRRIIDMCGFRDMEVSFVFRGGALAFKSAVRFLDYLRSLPEEHRAVWLGFHGIATHRASTRTYTTARSRFDPLSVRRVVPNTDRQKGSINRLGDGLYFASHLSYNFHRGFFERLPDGSLSILMCFLAPGKDFCVAEDSCPTMATPPAGYHSKTARTSITDATNILCAHRDQAFHVFAEMRIHDISWPV